MPRVHLDWKVRNGQDDLVATCLHADDAAVLVSALGDGASVHHACGIRVWLEGYDGKAGESFDAAATTMCERVDAWSRVRRTELLREAFK